MNPLPPFLHQHRRGFELVNRIHFTCCYIVQSLRRLDRWLDLNYTLINDRVVTSLNFQYWTHCRSSCWQNHVDGHTDQETIPTEDKAANSRLLSLLSQWLTIQKKDALQLYLSYLDTLGNRPWAKVDYQNITICKCCTYWNQTVLMGAMVSYWFQDSVPAMTSEHYTAYIP